LVNDEPGSYDDIYMEADSDFYPSLILNVNMLQEKYKSKEADIEARPRGSTFAICRKYQGLSPIPSLKPPSLQKVLIVDDDPFNIYTL